MAGRRILLAEDSSTMRRILTARLEEEGFEVQTAVDGNDAISKIRAAPPELILTDYEMPELDGAGLCRALKLDPEVRTIPVLMLTTLGEVENRVQELAVGGIMPAGIRMSVAGHLHFFQAVDFGGSRPPLLPRLLAAGLHALVP